MWLAVFADVGVMILAVLNAIRALFVKIIKKYSGYCVKNILYNSRYFFSIGKFIYVLLFSRNLQIISSILAHSVKIV